MERGLGVSPFNGRRARSMTKGWNEWQNRFTLMKWWFWIWRSRYDPGRLRVFFRGGSISGRIWSGRKVYSVQTGSKNSVFAGKADIIPILLQFNRERCNYWRLDYQISIEDLYPLRFV
jgi:hypothetical protein